MDQFLTENGLLVVVIWSLVYLADYYLTICAAALYRRGIQEHVVFQGSYELTPAFQADVDRLALLSPAFMFRLVLSWFMIGLVWLIAVEYVDMPYMFTILMGALLLREAAVLLRHARNLAFFGLSRAPGALRGQIEYARGLSLRLSAAELFSFAVLYLILAGVGATAFFLGGALGCTVTSLQHWRYARKYPLAFVERPVESLEDA